MELKCLQIDLARQKENIEFIISYIDFAKYCGYNAVIFYLENAVRTESTQYFDTDETYSQEEIKLIVNYCKKVGIEAIPALQNLGHLEKFFKYEELSGLSELADGITNGRFGAGKEKASCGCLSNPHFTEFFDRYTIEVCSLFESNYVHMGLDEVFDLAVCPKCMERIKNGESRSTMFLKHILHTHSLITGLGKTMMMWDDFFEYLDVVEDIPRDIILCNWNYGFVGHEPPGHWTGRIKKDWFSLYDKLGIRYMFCTYASRTSSTYNIDTFLRYAKKYKPIGAIMTTWENACYFYQSHYLSILYFGALLNGKINSHRDKTDLYKSFLETDEDFSCFMASLQTATFGANFTPEKYYEEVGLVRHNHAEYLRYALNKLKSSTVKAERKDIITCIYDGVFEIYLGIRLQCLAKDIFDGYITNNSDTGKYIAEIEDIRSGYKELQSHGESLWSKYRKGIKSTNNFFDNKFSEIFLSLDWAEKEISENKRKGVLILECVFNDVCSTAKLKINVKYIDGEEVVLYDGIAKPSTAYWDLSGNYTRMFATCCKKIKSADITVYGEGAIGISGVKHCLGTESYFVKEANNICGQIYCLENILSPDLRFAYLGNDYARAHIDDLSLAKQLNTATLFF